MIYFPAQFATSYLCLQADIRSPLHPMIFFIQITGRMKA